MESILRSRQLRIGLLAAAALATVAWLLQGLAYALLSSNGQTTHDLTIAGTWVLFGAYLALTVGFVVSAWNDLLGKRYQLAGWRLGGSLALMVMTIGTLVRVGTSGATSTGSRVLLSVGLGMWALLFVAAIAARFIEQARGGVLDQRVNTAFALGLVASVCLLVGQAVPSANIGDVTPAVVGAVFSAVGYSLGIVALTRVRPVEPIRVRVAMCLGVLAVAEVAAAVLLPLAVRLPISLAMFRATSIPMFLLMLGAAGFAYVVALSIVTESEAQTQPIVGS